ncbi:hypothetical protein M8J76_007350 [Diaphorina citri]|nr:hypothetical protein M8J76_007350 [Diaphorina citri]
MTSQRFCLRWNNHQSNLLSVFDQLLHDESFVDVTLAVDGRYLKAHKIVLSACSPYFQALFVGHPDRHPIVILKDIPYVDMRSLLDFMYRGEVSVDQDRLTTFLKVAESLRIKGLTEVNEDQCDLPKMASSLLSNPDHLNSPLSAGSISLSYRQRLKRHMSGSQHGLNTSLQTNNPLLGSALTGPKRKRGLPRKLSGSLSAGLDVMPDGDEEEEGGGMCEEEVEEEYDEERSVASDSDMIERSDSPFDNKMLEVNMSEAKPPQPHRRPSSEDESSVCNMEERGEGGRSPSPGREEEGGAAGDKPLSASQELVSNVKAERDTEGNSGGDQTERTSPTPERFPPGYLQHLLKLKSLDISKRVFDSMFRQGGVPVRPSGELPKDLTTSPAFGGVLPGALGFPGSMLGGYPIPGGTTQPPGSKPNPMGGTANEEPESSRPLSNLNDDKFFEDMISCSDEDVEEIEDSTNNNNDYDEEMRKYEYTSYKMLERNRRKERGEDGNVRGMMGGTRPGGGDTSGLMNMLGKGNDKFPKTNIEYRTDLGELTIETSGSPSMPGTSINTKITTGAPSSGRSRRHHSSSSSMSLVPFSTNVTGGASTSATSPREHRSFIDKASVRQFCTQEGEHIFRCNICLKTYTHISNFCRHFLSAHDDRYKQEISCPVCYKMFTRRDNMMTHTKQVHRITLMRGTLQPVYLDQENGAAGASASAATSVTTAPPSTTTATSTS